MRIHRMKRRFGKIEPTPDPNEYLKEPKAYNEQVQNRCVELVLDMKKYLKTSWIAQQIGLNNSTLNHKLTRYSKYYYFREEELDAIKELVYTLQYKIEITAGKIIKK